MDTTSQLKSLSHEAVLFAQIIDFNPADNCDLLNACELFSDYLEHQLDQLNDASRETTALSSQLDKLCQLIKPAPLSTSHKTPWELQLSSYIEEVEVLKNIAN